MERNTIMKINYTCPNCKSNWNCSVKNEVKQIELTCPNCKKATLVNIDNNTNYAFNRAAALGIRLLLKCIFRI